MSVQKTMHAGLAACVALLLLASYSWGLNCCSASCCRQTNFIFITAGGNNICYGYIATTCYNPATQTGGNSYTPTGDGNTTCTQQTDTNAEFKCMDCSESCVKPNFPMADVTNVNKMNGNPFNGCMATGAKPSVWTCPVK